jgi:hypothetical protein
MHAITQNDDFTPEDFWGSLHEVIDVTMTPTAWRLPPG